MTIQIIKGITKQAELYLMVEFAATREPAINTSIEVYTGEGACERVKKLLDAVYVSAKIIEPGDIIELIPLDIKRIERALRGIFKGERVVYHSGNLAADAYNDFNIFKLRALVQAMESQGTIKLFQKKKSDEVYEYIAIGS